MTLDEALALPVGRELDKAVGRTLGFAPISYFALRSNDYYTCYSTSVSAAWHVVDKLQKEYAIDIAKDIDGMWTCSLWSEHFGVQCAKAIADTVPLAICRAAMKCLWKELSTESNP